MDLKRGLVAAGLVILTFLLLTFVSATTTQCDSVSSCNSAIAAASAGDTIQLNTSLTGISTTAIDFQGVDNITFNCGGNSIVGDGTASTYGVYFNSTGDGSNYDTLRNCTLSGFESGVFVDTSDNNTITDINSSYNSNGFYLASASHNNITNSTSSYNSFYGINLISNSDYNLLSNLTLSSNSNSGINVGSASYCNLTKSRIENNSVHGISLGSYVVGDSFYDNLFNNSVNFPGSGGLGTYSSITYNITKTLGTNIVGGPYIGGNYWAYPNGTGPSETCTDANSDGICDTALTITNGHGVDYLPLTNTVKQCDSVSSCNSAIASVRSGGKVELTTDLTNIITTAIDFQGKSGITFDCMGNSISAGRLTGTAYGVYLNGTVTGSSNDIVTNCSIDGFEDGIYSDTGSDNLTISYVNITNSSDSGAYLYGNNNTIFDSKISGSTNYGIYVGHTVNGTIYNNLLNNTNNLGVAVLKATAGTLIFNTTKTFGTNIVGGPYIGGNYWATPSGNGFSDNCTDANHDGLCDVNDSSEGGGIDYLPLTTFVDVAPSVAVTYPVSGTSYSSVTKLNYTASDNVAVADCWYSLDGGATNSSPDSSCANFTGLTAAVGSHTWTVYANDTSGNVNFSRVTFAVSAPVSEGSTGGSSGGSSSSAGYSPGVHLVQNVPHLFQPKDPSLSVDKISVLSNKSVYGVSVNAVPVEVFSQDLNVSDGKIYQRFKVSPSGIDDSSIQNVTFSFSVNRSWIESNGLSYNRVALYRMSGGVWNALKTSYNSSDSLKYYYTAVSPGFSNYTIFAGKVECVSGNLRCSGNNLQSCSLDGTWNNLQVCEYGCESSNCSSKPAGSAISNIFKILKSRLGFFLYFLIAAFIIVVALIIFFAIYLAGRSNSGKGHKSKHKKA